MACNLSSAKGMRFKKIVMLLRCGVAHCNASKMRGGCYVILMPFLVLRLLGTRGQR
jgi:hypothetical protein